MRPGLFLVLTIALSAAAQTPTGELIFPLEKWHNHSSSLVELPGGDLFVCWYHGSGERTADDVIIESARLKKGSSQWTDRALLADTPGFPDTNPVMFVDSRQRLYLFWAPIIANEWHTALIKYRIAFDAAKWPLHWDHQDNVLLIPKNIAAKTRAVFGPDSKLTARAEDKYFSRLGWFGRTHPLELPSGRILLPLYSDGYSFSLMAISDDRGITWTASEPIITHGGIQPSVVRKNDGTLVAYMRDNGPPPKRVQVAYSKDDGVSWTDSVDTDIPNPGVSIEAIRLKSGAWLMVYNDLESGRYSLAAALSDDEGATWKWKKHLDRSDNKHNAYHYPSVIQTRDGSIHLTYSYFVPEGKSIKHVQFQEDWMRQP
jgi:predicted neuraminidase